MALLWAALVHVFLSCGILCDLPFSALAADMFDSQRFD